MADTDTKPTETKGLDDSYDASLGQDDVDKGIEAAQAHANSSFYNPAALAAKATPIGRAVAFIKDNKKGTSAGVVVAGIVALMIFISGSLAAGELIHLYSILSPHSFGPSERMENKRGVMRLRRSLRCIKQPSSRLCTGGGYSDKLGNWGLDIREARLKNKGIDLVYENPNAPKNQRILKEIRTKNGTVLSANSSPAEFDAGLRQVMNEHWPVHRVGKRYQFRKLVTVRTGQSWKFFKGAARTDSDSARNRMMDVDPNDTTSARAQEDIEAGKDKNGNDIVHKEQPEVDTGNKQVNDALGNVRAEVQKGGDVTTAAAAEAKKISGRTKSLAIITLIIGCIAKTYHDHVANLNQEQQNGIMEFSSNFMAAAHQQMFGEDVEAEEIGEAVEVFRDNDGDDIVETPMDSAIMKRAIGQPVTGDEQDLNLSVNNKLSAASSAVNFIGAVTSSIPGAGLVCKFVASAIVGYIAAAVEYGLVAFSGGTLGVVTLAGKDFAMARIFTYAFSLLTFPNALIPDGPVMAAGMAGMGMNYSNNEYARSEGHPPLSKKQRQDIKTAYLNEQAEIEKSRSFAWRYLSPQNPRSLLTQFAMKNLTPGGLRVAAKRTLDIPKTTLQTSFAAVTGWVGADVEDKDYDIQQFGFTDKEIETIDPVENKKYIESFKDYRCQLKSGGDPKIKSHYVTAGGKRCNFTKWTNAVHLDLLVNKCMALPYYEVEKGEAGKWKFKDKAGPVKITVNCKERSDLYVKAGMWTFDKAQDDKLECLTTDTACSGGPSGSSGGGTTAAPGNQPGPQPTMTCQPLPGHPSLPAPKIVQGNVPNISVIPKVEYQGKVVTNPRADIAQCVYNMMVDAKKAGVSLSGGGFRSIEGQIEARKRNGCPDIYDSPASSCRIPTARPGKSNHGWGVAIDFNNCKTRSTACYKWLAANASKYGFKNLPSEAWHWSVNGG